MDVMLLIRAGRLAEAEEAAQASARLGAEVGDADAAAYAAAHLLTIRWLQGRGGELLDLAEQASARRRWSAPSSRSGPPRPGSPPRPATRTGPGARSTG